LAAGVHVKVVSARLGHEQIMITPKHIAHDLPPMQQKAAAAINLIFCDNPLTSHSKEK
jgi:hypothetical protein